MSDYLTHSELLELTGRKQRPAQIAWLRVNRWRYAVDANGTPRVLRAYRDKRLFDREVEAVETVGPDFAAIS